MSKRTRIIGGAVFGVLVLGAAYALLILPNQFAARELDRFAAALPPGWSLRHGATRYGLFDRTLRVDDLSIEASGEAPARADRLTVVGGTGDGSPAAPFRADAVEVAGWSQGQFAINRLVAEGVALRPGALPSLAGLPPMRRLRVLLDVATVRHLVIEGEHEPNANGARVIADDAGGGRIGHLLIEDASTAQPPSRIARIETRGLDVAALSAVFDPTDYRPGRPQDPRRSLVEAADVTGIATEDAETRTEIARLHLAGLAGRPFIVPPTVSPAAPDPRLGPDMLASLAAEAASVEGVMIKPLAPQQAPGSIALDRLAYAGYAEGRLRSMRLEGLAITVPGRGAGTLRLFELRDVDASRLLGTLAALGAEAARRGRTMALGAVLAGSNNTVKLPYFALEDVVVTPLAGPAGPAVTLAALHSEAAYDGDAVSRVHQTLDRLAIPLKGFDLSPETRALITAFGRDRVVLGLDLAMSMAPRRLVLENLQLTAEALGDLRLGAAFADVDRAALDGGDYAGAFADAALERATLRYEDASLAERLLAVAAAQSGTTPEAMRQALIAAADAYPVAGLARAAAAFLRQPHVLVVKAEPPRPVPLRALTTTQPDEAAEMLGLTATAE